MSVFDICFVLSSVGMLVGYTIGNLAKPIPLQITGGLVSLISLIGFIINIVINK